MSDELMPEAIAVKLGPRAIIHLPSGLQLRIVDVDASYWRHMDSRRELADGRILSMFEYTETWTWRERHPDGDELVVVLEGRAHFELGERESVRTLDLQQGECGIVPAGTWHRALIHRPTRMLFVTPTPAKTETLPA